MITYLDFKRRVLQRKSIEGFLENHRYWKTILWSVCSFETVYSIRNMIQITFKKISPKIRRIIPTTASLGLLYYADSNGILLNTHPETLRNLFIGAGAMVGGMLAIVFTLTLFVQQNAADLYTSQFYEIYVYGWRDKFTYAIVALASVFLFFSTLWITENGYPKTIIYVGTFFIGIVFTVIDWHYEQIRTRINPFNAIRFLKSNCLKYLHSINRLAEDIGSETSNGDIAQGTAIALAYRTALHPYVENLRREIESLLEIALRLSKKTEISVVKAALDAVRDIMCQYLRYRRRSSVAIPSFEYLLAYKSDSNSFIQSMLERLNSMGEDFLYTRQKVNLIALLDVYESLCIEASEIEFERYENPILDQIRGYYSILLDAAIDEKDLEFPFQSIQRLRRISQKTVEKGLNTTTSAIVDDLSKLSRYGIQLQKHFITDRSLQASASILINCIAGQTPVNMDFASEKALNLIRDFAAIAPRLQGESSRSSYVTNSFHLLSTGIQNTLFEAAAIEDDTMRYRHIKHLLDFINDEYYHFLRKLSEIIKDASSFPVHSIACHVSDMLEFLVGLLDTKAFLGHRNEVERALAWYVHLPTWFIHYAEAIENTAALDELIDSPVKTALNVVRRSDQAELLLSSTKSICSAADNCLNKITTGHGYDEARIAMHMCYVGIACIKYRKLAPLQLILEKIHVFEDNFGKKYSVFLSDSAPESYKERGRHPVLYEMRQFRREFVNNSLNTMPLMHSAREMLYKIVTINDLDFFIEECWNIIPRGTAAAQDISRRRYIRRLSNILRRLWNHKSSQSKNKKTK